MTDVSDDRLLEQFARNGSEEAFAALVQRHIALVHSVALRHTSNLQHAEDITQAVFVILARKAGSLGRKTVLPGWLYCTARLTAANLQRAETRRVRREQEVFMQSKLEESPTDTLWRELSPQLDEAMAGLGTSERDALVLRYFQNKSMAEVGELLGLEENTAQKRVSRALEKLRKFFAKRGVDSTADGLAETISTHSVQAVPVALAKSVTAVALAKGATASISTLTLIKGALKIMAWTKTKTAIVASACVLLAAGTSVVVVQTIYAHRSQPNIQGAWEGVVPTVVGKLRVVLKVVNQNGIYRATIESIDQRTKDIPVNKLVYRYPSLQLDSAAVQGSYDGKVNADATEMSGTWKQPALTTTLLLKRTATPTPIPKLLTETDYTPRAGSDLQGYWKGGLNVGTVLLSLVFRISEPADGTFNAELDSPDQGVTSLVISSVTYNKPAVRIEVGSLGGVFEGDLGGGGKEIVGTWTQGGKSLPLTVSQTNPQAGQGQESKDYSHSGEDDLRGHWQGALDVKGMKLRLALHVGKLSNGDLSGSLDSLDQGAKNIPTTGIRFTPPEAHLEWKTLSAVFDGKLQDGKLTGTWRQGAQSFPLTFERSAAN